MKILVGFSRIFVAILFIFSGFVKLNDPLGFSYKLQEYFSEGVLNLEFLIPFSLLLAIFLVIFEIVLGVTLLLGYLQKFTLWSLLLMIVFFTFLTFYSAYFNKVTDCGCFGDALPLTPWESFTKDVILLVLILILFAGRKYITPIKPVAIHKYVVFVVFSACLVFGYYVLMHLPAIDFRAYKIGANIEKGMEVPPNAPEAVFEYSWKFKVNGEEKIVTTNGSYPDVDGEFIGVETTTIKEGYVPPIHDFSITSLDGQDYTDEFLAQKNVILVIMYNLVKSEAEGLRAIKEPIDRAMELGYTVIGLTASSEEDIKEVKDTFNLNFDFYTTDETALKTVIRSNPGIVQLKEGTIVDKLHWNDVNELELQKVEPAKPLLNQRLKGQLDSIVSLDQKGRNEDEISWEEQQVIDSTNTVFIEKVFDTYGYPGKSLVGEESSSAAWLVIQHSDKIDQYLPLIKEAAEKDEIPFRLAAMMEDRSLMQNNKEQIYGTQGTVITTKNNKTVPLIWPIKNPEDVNERRNAAGFDSTVEEYCQGLLGVEYKVYTLEEVNNMKQK
ncbi:BT_3928 family protein [Aquimarina brevivitae]|uniref:Putative membrane protein YphA (DoxX/SURF4 family) n=1 Tax=Aquimarina brevivitae TaxID=323412 RepID=A0A4Q7PHG4_9FLAO|nr:BT_3928 family protein [Aquimarina brevivitae]RZT00014.1 putative membrane protein YphA (DoxX/SURF4 family) [Aquimarina brevivitae]